MLSSVIRQRRLVLVIGDVSDFNMQFHMLVFMLIE
jgi:hypothetical protein